jgi:hypothetical protein
MTTELREPKNAAESGKVMERRDADTRQTGNRWLSSRSVFKTGGLQGPRRMHCRFRALSAIRVKLPESIFCAAGGEEDGNRYVRAAIERGAIAIASESAPPTDLTRV